MKKIKEKPTLSERIKETAVSTPRELLHRGLDDGSERLRTQLRDTAQHGQADEHGGDTIEDTAARGLRRAEKELTRQRKKRPQEQPPEGGAPAADGTVQKSSAIKEKDTTSAGPQPQSAALQPWRRSPWVGWSGLLCGFAVAAVAFKCLLNGGGGNEGVSCYVVDDLGIDVAFAAEYAQTGSLGGAGDLAAYSVVALDALSSGIRSLNHSGTPPFT